jgi:signal transduction histidine kinase
MTDPIGPDGAPGRLSSDAAKMLSLRDAVLAEWIDRLRATVKEAENLPQPILINTFPVLYQAMIESITFEFVVPRREGNTVASEHGGERARLTNYNVDALISEYQLLRWTVFDVFARNAIVLGMPETACVNAWIDGAIRDSVAAFALAEAALRERFVHALAHDMRNPLAAASMSTELIRRLSTTPKQLEMANRVSANLGRLDEMIKELLDAAVFHAAKRLKLHLTECDIHEVARSICEQFELVHGPRLKLVGQTARGCWDCNALQRAMENLIGNAVKYGDPGTTITLTVSTGHERTIIAVHNEGRPVPPDEMESVFQVFQRSTAARDGDKPGWGIGLPFVRSVAESHGGSVGIDSAEGRGTTFTIDIPSDARPYQNAPVLGG